MKARLILQLGGFIAVLGAVVLLPAWSVSYWQGWAFLADFAAGVVAISAYLLVRDPGLLERRLKAGEAGEQSAKQRAIVGISGTLFFALLIVPGLDHRFGAARVPAWVSIGGLASIAVGFAVVWRVFRENTFTSSVIEVDSNQRVIDTGPYRVVRHPMYSGALLVILGAPLALGSYWALLLVPPLVTAIVVRLLDEEAFLAKNLEGYRSYLERTRRRLVPSVW